MIALTAVELRALGGALAQRGQDRAGGRQQAVLTRGGSELGEAGAEDEASLQIA